MRTLSPVRHQNYCQCLRPLTLVSVALLLVLALACGAAEQPQQPAESPGQLQPAQSQPVQSQPAQSPPTAEVLTEPGRPTQENAGGDTGQSDKAMTTDTVVPGELSPVAAKDMAANQPSVVQGETNEVAVPTAEAIAVPAESQTPPPAVVAEPTQSPNSSQTVTPVPAQTPSQQVTLPTPTNLPVQEPAPTPAAPATNTPTPVALEPLPDVGNQVGNLVPDITLELVGGATVSTSGLIEQGRPTFLFFTSTT